MKRTVVLWQLLGFVFVSLFGVILHFLFDWTGSVFTALFSAVNESTWEHMKLIFFPMFAFAALQYFVMGKTHKDFWCIKLQGLLIGLILIPVLFYTLHGAFGATPDWINIAIFFVAAAAAYIYETNKLLKKDTSCKSQILAFVILCIIALCFAVFTLCPPEIPLFQDPIKGSFGI